MPRTRKQTADSMPTVRQYTVLWTLVSRNPMTPEAIGVRRDVLWRMEEAGWVARNLHDRWRVLSAGEQAIERYRKHHGL